MTVLRHKRAVRDRDSGLVFSWRLRMGSRVRMTCAVLTVLSVTALAATLVKVRVASVQRVVERKGGILLIPSGRDSLEWQIRCDEAGPFPAKFDLASYQVADPVLEKLARADSGLARYHPQPMGFPEEPQIVFPSASAQGERVFPAHTAEVTEIPAKEPLVLKPVLHVLSKLAPGAEPTEFPPYPCQIGEDQTKQDWRFVVRVTEGGRVSECMPLVGAAQGVEDWVRSIRFGRSAFAAGWFGVEVRFAGEH